MDYFRRIYLYWTILRRLGALIDIANAEMHYSTVGWIFTKYGKFYVRVGWFYLPNLKSVRAITLASVEIQEQYWRRGFFKIALTAIEEQAKTNKFGAVVVENVLNNDLHLYLFQRGYIPREYDQLTFAKVF